MIPAAVRRQVGLLPGMEMELLLDEGSIRLVPLVRIVRNVRNVRHLPGPRLERRGKLLVARPRVPAKDLPRVDMAKLVEEERSHRPR